MNATQKDSFPHLVAGRVFAYLDQLNRVFYLFATSERAGSHDCARQRKMMMNAIFRKLLGATLVSAALLAAPAAIAQDALTEYKIGFQKTGLPVVAQRQGTIEAALKDQGIAVKWVEFQAGPPLVEALNVGSIDAGWVGDAPPIFGQSAGANIVYVAALPSNGAGEAVFVKDGSPIKSLADLKGHKVGVGKGTSANNLLIAAVQSVGLTYGDIEPVYLGPADAAAAFASDAIDAWVVWDPYFAIAESQQKVNVLVRSSDILSVNTYFLANGDFAKAHGDVLTTTVAALGEAAAWADAHREEVAAALHEVTGVPLEAQTVAANRAKFGIWPVTDEIVAGQQATADRFFEIGLIPNKVTIKDAVWSAN